MELRISPIQGGGLFAKEKIFAGELIWDDVRFVFFFCFFVLSSLFALFVYFSLYSPECAGLNGEVRSSHLRRYATITDWEKTFPKGDRFVVHEDEINTYGKETRGRGA